MQFNIYLDELTGRRLAVIAKQTGQGCNDLIRKAVREWLDRHVHLQWPEAVVEFSGIPDMPPFESSRGSLTPPAKDPLA